MKKLYRILAGLLVGGYFLISVVTLPRYGVNWDEVNHSTRGQAYIYFFLTGKKQYDQSLFAQGNRYSLYQIPGYDFNHQIKKEGGHPPLSDILSSLFNYIFYQKLEWLGDIEAYHLYGVVLTGVFAGFIYLWVEGIYGGFPGLVSLLALLTYPLFYGESHFNVQKDIPEAAYLTMCALVFYTAFIRKSTRLMILTGILAGLALGTKLNVLFLVPVVILWVLLLGIRKSINLFKLKLFLIPVIAFVIYYISWPWLWLDPIGNITKSLGYYQMMGIVSEPALPTSYYILGLNTYAIQWVLYTTPLITLFLSCAGIWWVIRHGGKEKSKTGFYILLLFIVPVVRVSFPLTSIYGGVRQIMEYIPPLAILAGIGAKFLTDKFKKYGFFPQVLIIILFVPITAKMISMHPNESIYFNPIIGGLKGAAERNIPGWGNSLGSTYRQGLRWLNANAEEKSKLSTIFELRSNIPPIDIRSDFDFQNRYRSGIYRDGEYVIGVTHNGTQESSYYRKYLDRFLDPVYEVRVEGVAILKVWKNDLAHTKKEYMIPDKVISNVVVTPRGRSLLIDLGAVYQLTQLNLFFSPNECSMEEGGRIDGSREGSQWANIYPDIFGNFGSRFAPYDEPGNLQYPFAADEVRYIRITHYPLRSCLMTTPVKASARGYGPLNPSTE
ncbi:hypothetical protein A3A79_04860 [Candidatus Gottesmanbacteria bacterium RIFCSPLOWO2_01_FULL_43_11b]|uniref:Glycosyltransferase RgtA/B/C/D-like domain-containing protein n=1 Tax=Candidatus Gottesmanbacteria bacterium RIFCSPLOWO2_01_FULL_43_11b TaxID=1798392 RepID=A0A1F6AIM5_9BACT|nr:MAG: hypothetical protein A3A79_04860 [Candidatus Gottesmanbacteria bacterium RIFCSPLOWO2_01_FULL_43_11b]